MVNNFEILMDFKNARDFAICMSKNNICCHKDKTKCCHSEIRPSEMKDYCRRCWLDFLTSDEGLDLSYLDEASKEIEKLKKENGVVWHKVADGDLPELDKKVLTIRSADDDIPTVAKRHIYTSYGRTEWEWECYWGSGFDLKQNEIFAWSEIPKFEEE